MNSTEYLRRLRATLRGFRHLGPRWLAPALGYLAHPLLRRLLPAGTTLRLAGFTARVGTDDFFVLGQIFREYHYPDVQAAVRRARLVIDAGANVGAFCWLVRQIDPRIPVVAIEPEDANFRSLSRQSFAPGVRCLQGALAPEPGTVFLHRSANSATHQTRLDDTTGIPVTAYALAQLAGEESAVFVKMDIEGAEQAILERPLPPAVQDIVMEWHYATPPPTIAGVGWISRGEASFTWRRD